METVILLNASMEALAFIPWQDAVTKLVNGEVEVLRAAPDKFVRSQHLTLPWPEIVYLKRYVEVPYVGNEVDLSSPTNRRAILKRDGYTCGYCGKKGSTIDHIYPQSRGGKDTWGNLITACQPCNNRKADKTPEECGLRLLWEPRAVTDPLAAAQELVWTILRDEVGVAPVSI